MELNVAELSLFWQLTAVFGAGFLTSLTPCVYPLLPVTVSLFGAMDAKSRKEGFLLSLSYVFGISTTYTALGLLSASTGMIFGSFLSNVYVILGITALLTFLALFTLDIMGMPKFLSKIQNKANQFGGKGFAGAYTMGLVSGVVAAPCVGPALIVILGIAATQEMARGGLLLLVYSFGLGIPFLVIGTFSGAINKIPRAGGWLNGIKFIMATSIFLVALYLAKPALGFEIILPEGLLWTLSGLAVAAGFLAYRREIMLLKPASSIILAITLFGLFLEFDHTPVQASAHNSGAVSIAEEVEWKTALPEALAEAKARETFVMVDLFADWCAACKELDRHTFSHPTVQESFKSIIPTRLDFTESTDETDDLADKYNVLGLPTILFLDSSGNEIENSRITGFLDHKEFLKHFSEVRSKSQ